MQLPLKHPIFKILSGIAAEKGIEAYVIGGYVRDLLLQRPSKDIDIVVHGSGIELAETAARRLGNLRVICTPSACKFPVIFHKNAREYIKYSLRFLFHLTKNLTTHLSHNLCAVLP